MNRGRDDGLLAWQWALYPDGHRDRRNLAVHAATVPLFLVGSCAVPLAALAGGWLAVAGSAAMITAIGLQGRTHRLEVSAPVPFTGPLDVVARLFAEQWVTFPRFVLSGEFRRAWRATRPITR